MHHYKIKSILSSVLVFAVIGVVIGIFGMSAEGIARSKNARIPEFEAFIRNELLQVADEIHEEDAETLPEDQSRIFLTQIWLRIRAGVGFEVPGLVKISVTPEAEMVWQRHLPEEQPHPSRQ